MNRERGVVNSMIKGCYCISISIVLYLNEKRWRSECPFAALNENKTDPDQLKENITIEV